MEGIYTVRSQHVAMPDGCRIAVDVVLPAGPAGGNGPWPVILRATRYWRSRAGGDPVLLARLEVERRHLTRRGYGLVVMDVRGTGASFGVWEFSQGAEELDDMGHVVDWVAAQPWCDGRLGAHGVSYDANAALFFAASGRPAVRAAIARFPDWDIYRSPVYPGGVFCTAFLTAWTDRNARQDAGVARGDEDAARIVPVDDDTDGSLLAAALAEHDGARRGGRPAHGDRDELVAPNGSDTIDSISPYAHAAALAAGGAALQLWAGWHDAGTADAVTEAYLALRDTNHVEVLVGPWSHGARHPADPFAVEPGAPVEPSPDEQWELMLDFFDAHVRDAGGPDPTGVQCALLDPSAPPGQPAWWTFDEWPPAHEPLHWEFCAAATVAGGEGCTTGTSTRWHTQVNGGLQVFTGDRAEVDAAYACFDGDVLDAPLVLAGTAVASLTVSSDADDGAVFVHLEAVAPDGRVSLLTEGQLRLRHRAVAAAPYRQVGPWHPCTSAAALPLEPGEEADVELALLPVAVRLPAGWRLRVAVAGRDEGVFQPVPRDGAATITLHRGSLRLPVVPGHR